MRARFLLAVSALAVFATAGPVMAQTPLPEPAEDPLDARDARRVERMEKVVRELRAIVFQSQKTGKPVVVQPADADARMAELGEKLNDLETTLRSLNGTVDTLTRDLDAARRETAALKTQLDTLGARLAAVEQRAESGANAGAPPTLGGNNAPAAAAAAGDPAKDFAAARQLMLAGDYDGAEAAFSRFVEAYPDSPRTAEANYWWGKTLSVRGAHAEAAQAYIGAIRGWPQTTWAPDGVVELSRSLIALRKPTDACQALGEFARRYPKAPPTVSARAAAARTQAKCAA